MPIQRAKTRLRSVNSPAAASDAAKPIAATRDGPSVAVDTALLTIGSASVPSALAPAIMTTAMVMPVMPIRAPANATRASCTEPRTVASALPSTVRIVPAKCRNTKPAIRISSAPIRLFNSLFSAQFVHSWSAAV
jgi:hypothetical protein